MPLEFTNIAGLVAALTMGLAGGAAHCTLMCGGLALAGARIGYERGQARLRIALLHAGRVSTYLLLALLLAAVGDVFSSTGVQQARRAWQLLLGLLLLLLALDQLGKGRLAAVLSARIGPVVQRALKNARHADLPANYLAGMAWGLIPCMLSWTAIVAAATLPLVAAAAAIGIFGLATALPLTIFQGVDRYFSNHSKLRWQKITHAAMAAYGLLMVAQATNLFNPHADHLSNPPSAIGHDQPAHQAAHHH